jgi:AraC family transcriptional regulator
MDYVRAVIKAVDFIESSLKDEFDLDTVCRSAALSKYHFSRIFQSMVGETVFDYVRKRRLAEIAHRLVTTDEPIIDLAIQFGYESQQSMTKSFRKQYGETPGAYRRTGKDRYFFHRPKLSRETVERLQKEFSLRTRILALPSLRIVGLREKMPITETDPVERTRSRFRCEGGELARLRRYRGVFEVTLMRRDQMRSFSREDPFDGLIGYGISEVAKPPQRFSELLLPASRYISFHYRGDDSIGRLSSLYRYIFSSGIAARREPLADRPFFHYYRPGARSMLFFLPIES